MRAVMVLMATCLLGSAAAAQSVDDYGITDAEHAACDADALSLCADAIPHGERVVACMKGKIKRLSPTCSTVFKAGLKRRRIPF